MKKIPLLIFFSVMVFFLAGCAENQMVERIRENIIFVDVDDDTLFQQAQENAVSTIFIAKKGDKSVMATKENPALKSNAIAFVRYKNFNQQGICVNVQQRKESEFTNCAFDERTNQLVVKMMVTDNELWKMLTQQVR